MKNKKVLVTGGLSGIGAALIEQCEKEGAHVCCLDINEGKHEKAELSFQCDVSREEDIFQTFEKIKRAWGHLDIVINNAGISIRESFLATSLDDWNKTLAINLTGPFLISKAALSLMKSGIIINISSVSGMFGMPNYVSYNVSKAGLIEFTKTLALELAPRFRVNAICPGYVLTPMQRKEYTDEALAECIHKIPMKRLGKPHEIAALLSYLCSDEAAFVTGQTFVIDGGESAGDLASF